MKTTLQALILLLGCLNTFGSIAHADPDFIVIFTDDQTYRAIGYNNPLVQTPALDQLAADGLILDNAYVASPVCGASRASIMTSLFPQQHSCVCLHTGPFVGNAQNGTYKCLPQFLNDAGYVTGFCGKSNLGHPQKYGFRHGKEHNDDFDDEAFSFASGFLEDRSQDQRPFLLWIAPRQPHVPLKPEKKWRDLYDNVPLATDPNFRVHPPTGSLYNQGLPGESYYRDSDYTKNYQKLSAGPPRSQDIMLSYIMAYYATISHMDHQVGELIAQLKEAGRYENTAIFFLSDNGYHLGNHGLGNKLTMHEESVRVPMFVHYPGMKQRGVHSDELVSSLDVLPTILELADVARPESLMGTSLVPLFDDAKHPLREFVASESVGLGGKVGDGHRMVRTKRWKYILTGVNDEALFDQHKDPFEVNNLAADRNRGTRDDAIVAATQPSRRKVIKPPLFDRTTGQLTWFGHIEILHETQAMPPVL
jgi:arylsulfatase A-like enzyme